MQAQFQNQVVQCYSSQNIRQTYPQNLNQLFDIASLNHAKETIQNWDQYQPTPLHQLKKLSESFGIQDILYKDESQRFILKSFKALGGAYAVYVLVKELLEKHFKTTVEFSLFKQPQYQDFIKEITIATATDGNHGRSVAWGCQAIGCQCKIYMHEGVSQYREQAVVEFGAQVIRVAGQYDDSLNQADLDANQNGWYIISDTSYEGYQDIPRYVMNGYTVMCSEIQEQYHKKPTHIFIQAGVGGLAAAVFAYYWIQDQEERPHFIIVEPNDADCLFQSAKAQKIKKIEIENESIMAGLSCGEPSLIAWQILSCCTDHYMTIDDQSIAPVMNDLYHKNYCNEKIIGGESGVAGLSAVIIACQQEQIKKQLQLHSDSIVLVIGSEGDTDPEIFQSMINE